MLYGGIVLAVLGLSKVHATWVADPAYDYTGSFRFAWSIAYAVLLVVAAYGTGLPDLPRSTRGAFLASLGAVLSAAMAVSILQLLVGDALLPRFVVFGAAAVLVPWYLVCVAVAQHGRARAEATDRVLFVGGDLDVAEIEADLAVSAERPAQVVGAIDLAELSAEEVGQPRLVNQASQTGATVVVLDRDAQGFRTVVEQTARLHESGIRVRTLSLFYEEWLGKLPASELERTSLMFDIGEVHRARYGRLKRMVDVVLGVVSSVLLLLIIPFVFVLNLAFNRGPLLYRQQRVGKHGAEFTILKFRTMRPRDEGGLVDEWTQADDPRITPLGRVMRVTHVDELPPAVNILRGDLSIVGPRPEQPHYVEELEEKLQFYELRNLVRPGLTGWAQVKYGYAGDESDALEKLQYDFYYLRHQGLDFDLRIVGRTLRSVVGRRGR